MKKNRHDISPDNFTPGFTLDDFSREDSRSLWFLFVEQDLLVLKTGNGFAVPESVGLLPPLVGIQSYRFFGSILEIPCFCAFFSLDNTPELSADYAFLHLREVYYSMTEQWYGIAARAFHIVTWSRMSRFCGQCGAKTVESPGLFMARCEHCAIEYFPKISPAVLVAIQKGDKILLARSKHHKSPFYSLIAGFVEPGENLEECVVRETREETGIEIHQITYQGSQPWPFSQSLMIGFRAAYKSGELTVDNDELIDARWFSCDALPQLPGKISLSRKMIDDLAQISSSGASSVRYSSSDNDSSS